MFLIFVRRNCFKLTKWNLWIFLFCSSHLVRAENAILTKPKPCKEDFAILFKKKLAEIESTNQKINWVQINFALRNPGSGFTDVYFEVSLDSANTIIKTSEVLKVSLEQLLVDSKKVQFALQANNLNDIILVLQLSHSLKENPEKIAHLILEIKKNYAYPMFSESSPLFSSTTNPLNELSIKDSIMLAVLEKRGTPRSELHKDFTFIASTFRTNNVDDVLKVLKTSQMLKLKLSSFIDELRRIQKTFSITQKSMGFLAETKILSPNISEALEINLLSLKIKMPIEDLQKAYFAMPSLNGNAVTHKAIIAELMETINNMSSAAKN